MITTAAFIAVFVFGGACFALGFATALVFGPRSGGGGHAIATGAGSTAVGGAGGSTGRRVTSADAEWSGREEL